jgi:uncharacterized protein GlcG (DUF336 family)
VAQQFGFKACIAVTDREGNVLALFKMTGAPKKSRVVGDQGQGLEGAMLSAQDVAIAKAGTAGFLSSSQHAFSTRTASFIVQDHFPPGVDFTPGGPLFGVQFSSLPCTDFKSPPLPLGLSADPGGVPLFKGGELVGGLGVEGDGIYGLDLDPSDDDLPIEERVAVTGSRGFSAPDQIRGDGVLLDGIRLPFVNAIIENAPIVAVAGRYMQDPRDGQPTGFIAASVGGVAGQGDPRFPLRSGSILTAGDVETMLAQAARQSLKTRAAIRQPLGSAAKVSIAVVDVDGTILGFFRLDDASIFGADVSVQKARTAAFFSSPAAGSDIVRVGLGRFLRDVALDGSYAYTTRAIGFLAQPYYPPGIQGTMEGPFSLPISEWSPFNTGLQFGLFFDNLANAGSCNPAIAQLPNGITIFPGGVPLYKNGRFAGGIGVSGDGVDQDDLIAAAGSVGFEAPRESRCDRLLIRGVRLPYVKFPRHPNL